MDIGSPPIQSRTSLKSWCWADVDMEPPQHRLFTAVVVVQSRTSLKSWCWADLDVKLPQHRLITAVLVAACLRRWLSRAAPA
jgi:hypothetical protein